MIRGKEAVISRLGQWPSFHDAEVVELKLAREGESILQIKTMYPPGNVSFHLEDVLDLQLADFNEQNVIGELLIEPREEGVRLSLSPCYGLSGWIAAKAIRVS